VRDLFFAAKKGRNRSKGLPVQRIGFEQIRFIENGKNDAVAFVIPLQECVELSQTPFGFGKSGADEHYSNNTIQCSFAHLLSV
jgi:hypothetical protein